MKCAVAVFLIPASEGEAERKLRKNLCSFFGNILCISESKGKEG
jgi:hypothetical protein